jgi:hypothetical protein
MLIGVPKEIKPDEYRVGLIPATIKPLTAKGHNVVVEARAGEGAGISDEEYDTRTRHRLREVASGRGRFSDLGSPLQAHFRLGNPLFCLLGNFGHGRLSQQQYAGN